MYPGSEKAELSFVIYWPSYHYEVIEQQVTTAAVQQKYKGQTTVYNYGNYVKQVTLLTTAAVHYGNYVKAKRVANHSHSTRRTVQSGAATHPPTKPLVDKAQGSQMRWLADAS